MTRDDLIKEIELLADEWSVEVKYLKHNELGEAANNLQVCVNDLRALVRQVKKEDAA